MLAGIAETSLEGQPAYLGRNERPICVCGAARERVTDRVWKVTDKETDLIYPKFMYRCPSCRSFSALNLYFPVEMYEAHSVDDMSIEDIKRILNSARLAWITGRTGLRRDAIVYDLGAGEGCFAHTFGAAFPDGRVLAVEGDAKVAQRFYGSMANVVAIPEYIEPFLQRAPGDPAVPAADLMVLTDVLEHVVFPEDVLARMANALAPGGHAYITIPESRTFQGIFPFPVRQRDVDWQHANRTCQHLWMLTIETLTGLVSQFFDIVDVSGYEEDIRRDSVYATVLGRKKQR